LRIRVLLLLASAVGLICPQLFGRILQVPATYTSIQSAINSSVNGDTVLVATGTYIENIDFRGRKITVASQFLLNPDINLIQQTIIDGSQPLATDSASVVRFVTREDSLSVLCGFTLRNGIGTLIPGSFAGGGILVTNSSGPIIRYNIIRQNVAIVGGGIAVKNGTPRIENNAIVHNSARDGGGLWCEDSWVRGYHNVVYSNDAEGIGGAVCMRSSFVTIRNSTISNNTSPTCGGISCSGGLWEISNCNFFQNQSKNFLGCGEPDMGDTSKAKNFNLDSADIYANIVKDPGFQNPVFYDFRLRCDSRLIDAGSIIPLTYPQGGAREDIGMFEYQFRVGDATGDGRINLADATMLVNIIFLGSPITCPFFADDCDCNRRINITDVVALINYWSGFHEVPACLFTPASLRR
jgi:hypothetical protein